MDFARRVELQLQGLDQRCGQHGDTVLVALAGAHANLPIIEIDVLDPQAQALHLSHAGTIQQPGYQAVRTLD